MWETDTSYKQGHRRKVIPFCINLEFSSDKWNEDIYAELSMKCRVDIQLDLYLYSYLHYYKLDLTSRHHTTTPLSSGHRRNLSFCSKHDKKYPLTFFSVFTDCLFDKLLLWRNIICLGENDAEISNS